MHFSDTKKNAYKCIEIWPKYVSSWEIKMTQKVSGIALKFLVWIVSLCHNLELIKCVLCVSIQYNIYVCLQFYNTSALDPLTTRCYKVSTMWLRSWFYFRFILIQCRMHLFCGHRTALAEISGKNLVTLVEMISDSAVLLNFNFSFILSRRSMKEHETVLYVGLIQSPSMWAGLFPLASEGFSPSHKWRSAIIHWDSPTLEAEAKSLSWLWHWLTIWPWANHLTSLCWNCDLYLQFWESFERYRYKTLNMIHSMLGLKDVSTMHHLFISFIYYRLELIHPFLNILASLSLHPFHVLLKNVEYTL